MRKLGALACGAVALLATSGRASAQTLNWYGMNACFLNATFTNFGGTGFSSNTGDCTNNLNTASLAWGEKNDSDDRSSLQFARSNPPGGPGDQGSGDPLSHSFSSNNTWIFSLGQLTYNNESVSTQPYTLLNTANLGFSLFFNSGSTADLNYLSQILATNQENGGTDQVDFSGGGGATFSVGGENYEFSVWGFDDTSHDICEESEDNDPLPSTLSASSGNSSHTSVCGKIKYIGESHASTNTTVPEPSTYALMASGLVGVFGLARRRRQNG